MFIVRNRCHYDEGKILLVLCIAVVVILIKLINVNPGSFHVVIRKSSLRRERCDSMNSTHEAQYQGVSRFGKA